MSMACSSRIPQLPANRIASRQLQFGHVGSRPPFFTISNHPKKHTITVLMVKPGLDISVKRSAGHRMRTKAMFLDEVGKTRNLLTADFHGSTRIKICLPANA